MEKHAVLHFLSLRIVLFIAQNTVIIFLVAYVSSPNNPL